VSAAEEGADAIWGAKGVAAASGLAPSSWEAEGDAGAAAEADAREGRREAKGDGEEDRETGNLPMRLVLFCPSWELPCATVFSRERRADSWRSGRTRESTELRAF